VARKDYVFTQRRKSQDQIGYLLHEQLSNLAIQPSGLPPHVVAHLRAIVEAEVSAIQAELADEFAHLQKQADERIRRQVAKRITLKSVGKAFADDPAPPPQSPHDTTPMSAQPDASTEAKGAQ
jgi:hypothetical protein